MEKSQTVYYSGLAIKLVVLLTLVLGLQIPVIKISELLTDRTERQAEASREISNMSGGAQHIITPLLQLEPRSHAAEETADTPESESGPNGTTQALVLASTLDVTTSVQAEKRYREIFELETYMALVTLKGEFSVPGVADTNPENPAGRAQGNLILGMTWPRFLREISEASIDGHPLVFLPGTSNPLVTTGVHAFVSLPAGRTVPFKLSFKVSGSSGFSVAPAAVSWRTSMTSNATEPSFIGSSLPVDRNVTLDGFQAVWSYGGVLGANVIEPNSDAIDAIKENAVGVSLLSGIDGYRMTERSLKYSLLFVFLTFLVFFTFEVMSALRIHPIQYLQVGCALILFYLLLLSFSEQVGFGRAYVYASGAAVLLVTGYSSSVLRLRSRALTVGALLSALYAYLYALLSEGDLALMYGSIGLTMLLAAVMYLTRRVDWYALGSEMLKPLDPGPPLPGSATTPAAE
jgi:inner membrane protein